MKTTRLSFFSTLNFSSLFSRLPLSSLFLTYLTLLVTNVATAQVPSYVPTNGLVGYWPFNGNANDESGNGNNGTVNGATLTADRFGVANSSYSFNGGSSNSISIPDNAAFNTTQGTWSLWVKTTSVSGGNGYGIMGKGSNTTSNIGIQEYQNHIGGKISWQSGAATAFGCGTYLVNDGNWHSYIITWDGANINGYFDGVLCGTGTYPGANLSNGLPIKIGRLDEAYWQSYNGSVDDIGIWNRVLTADELLDLFNSCSVSPQVVLGNSSPSAFTSSTYICDNNLGSIYTWTVSNGVIAGGQGTNSVSILWGAEGVGSVSVVETTADGCVGDAVVYDVNVQCIVSGNAIEGAVGPEAFSNATYTSNGAANSTYNWTVTNGVIVSGQGTSSVTVLWASTGLGNISVIETTSEGCVGTTLSQDVVVIPTNVEELSNALILYPNPVTTNLTLQVKSELIGSDFVIYDALGKVVLRDKILSSSQNISVNNLANGNYILRVGEMNKVFTISK